MKAGLHQSYQFSYKTFPYRGTFLVFLEHTQGQPIMQHLGQLGGLGWHTDTTDVYYT
jgi:hypothetical protein